jgi:hypothetical protein
MYHALITPLLSCLSTAPQDVRLIQRLRQVCKQEGLHVGNSAFIAELCSATGHDIRASINNLQFAALKTSKQQQMAAAEGVGCGAAGAWGSAFGAKSVKPGMAEVFLLGALFLAAALV